MEPSRRAAQVGLGAAIVMLVACVVLILTTSFRAGAAPVSDLVDAQSSTAVQK